MKAEKDAVHETSKTMHGRMSAKEIRRLSYIRRMWAERENDTKVVLVMIARSTLRTKRGSGCGINYLTQSAPAGASVVASGL